MSEPSSSTNEQHSQDLSSQDIGVEHELENLELSDPTENRAKHEEVEDVGIDDEDDEDDELDCEGHAEIPDSEAEDFEGQERRQESQDELEVENIDESEGQQSQSHSPTPASVEEEERADILFPNADGLFYLSLNGDSPEKCTPTDFSRFIVANAKIIVVGLFGKEVKFGGDFVKSKAVLVFDELMQRDVFSMNPVDPKAEPMIQGFHDTANNRVYLHLPSDNFDRPEVLQHLLFLFHVCHILVCHHPNHTLDLSYLRLFQTLDSARSKIQGAIYRKLRQIPNHPKWWTSHSRLCSPRLIFYYATCPNTLRGSRGTRDLIKKSGKVSKHAPIKRLEFALEDQIFHIYRRTKLSTPSGNGLFNLPPRDNYVYVNIGDDNSDGDPTKEALDNLFKAFDTPLEQDENTGSIQEFMPYFYHDNLDSNDSTTNDTLRSFSKFLYNHFNHLIAKGPDGESTSKSAPTLPTAIQWYRAISAIFPLIVHNKNEEDAGAIGRGRQALLNHTTLLDRFSEARCAKALPIALNSYKDGLQSHYLEEYHNSKLLQAMSVYYGQARGPATAKYAEKLVEEATTFWTSGRQMCEELSLTGNHCSNRKHKTASGSPGVDPKSEGGEDDSKPKKILPTMPHRSTVSIVSACNCGKRQGNRDDPFTVVEANYAYYAELEADCCRDLERVAVPVHAFQDDLLGGDEAGADLQSLANLTAGSSGKNKISNRSRCISAMLTKATPANHLPAFPSWSLIHLGSSTLYSHSSGVGQPGFLTAAKHLHAWDVPLKKIDWKGLQARWPNLAENAMKRSNFNPSRKGIEMGVTAKIFLGMEYECPRGHRFIAAGLDKAMRSAKEAGIGAKFANNDVALYLACPCKGSTATSSSLVAQLIRIHVVTPKAPVRVLFNPVVVPCPQGPEFIPGWASPPEMPVHAYWILRLPFIYCGESGSHLPPKEVPDIKYGRLLKGALTVVETD